MCKGATWRSMEPERWGECREKGGRRRDRERRSNARCYCPVCQLLEGTNKENWWAMAYHMSALLSLTLCSVIHSRTQYVHSGKCVTPLHLSCLPTLPSSVVVSPDLLPQSSRPTTSLVYRLKIQPPSSEAGGVWAGGRQAYRCRKKRMAGGGGDPGLPPR